jgi:excisionase family DNA binding protein
MDDTRDKPERWWLSAAELANLMGVHARTVKRDMVRGKWPFYRITGNKEYRILVLSLVKVCMANENLKFVMERFNERYTFATIKRPEIGPTNPTG